MTVSGRTMPGATTLSQPRLKTVKRLFAVSHNRCAFRACDGHLVDASGVVVGEICHIKGKPGGPRFDAKQGDEERHGYDNLILMCAEHHKVIDGEEATYSVDVLSTLKREHEATPLNVDADDVALQLLVNSGFSGDVKQTAGDRGINIAAANSSVVVNAAASALHERRVEAAQALWKAVLGVREAMPAFVISRLDIVTDAEYLGMFRSCRDLIALVNKYELTKALDNPGSVNVDDFSPFLPSSLWERFVAYRMFIGRVCLVSIGEVGDGIHWTRDAHAMGGLRNAVGAERVAEVVKLRIGRLHVACSMIQAEMLEGVRTALS